jgi:ADP-ribose pyrophosphatase YjhB (NUDIX family)
MSRARSLRFCPDCGAQAFLPTSGKSWRCASCDFVFYQNTAAAVAVIIRYAGEILFAVRAGEPQAGKLDLPGGFVDDSESAEAALSRELAEELGLRDVRASYMASFPNTYPYAGVDYKTVDLIYVAELAERPSLQPADDAAGVRWINVWDIPFEQVAFDSIRRALTYFRDHCCDRRCR